MPSLTPSLRQTKKLDAKYLKTTKVPIITVSGTYKEDLKGLHHLPENDLLQDIVLSRAHYSMAIGVAAEAWKNKLDPQEAWLVDPTNYVAGKKWGSIVFTDTIGKILARYPMLKSLKDIVDKFGRQKLPILESITPPLIKLTENIKKPILSFHIAAGNIMLAEGKTVFQMVTDPHVREDYLAQCDKIHAFYGVFDENTKKEFLEKAEKLGKNVDPDRVIVTGPPIDPRVLEARNHKAPWNSNRSLKICLTTGGLGTNKPEIAKIIDKLLPEMQGPQARFELMVYAGTHTDIKDLVIEKARKADISYTEINPIDPAQFEIGKALTLKKEVHKRINTKISVIYHPQIIDANELLIAYGFPWADLFISKPSGDMAYDAIASGAALLTLAEWGEWEHNIRLKFEKHEISQEADLNEIVKQLDSITHSAPTKTSWLQNAQHMARTIEKQDKLFRVGAINILKAVIKLSR
ncbi:MAG: hypothetical protein COU63_04730 [Candidatus Pacebacteria bacterium CG10_big_fil_rev_8_21_14_0_10_36_11]|nr:hypothetical protein [Candidatus Pacearchaeota archaeon]OIP73987.1 MAG: hypothetical protein AUK08_01885 [Candidatus Pacebacteria bacterium CG2_30_36_39]PIR64374.1 MAG: hypothetical protein COU63_04730 [Candidatus Pacebacteria bacterium CG10_big_fil_rev_8_21_14_0_10_36_11]PJC43070.1 MAG: hypothetical protein CO040_01100 [Candidatus Pacebacteria bacterium CG_4_9_14_0_2_um_filter_36_8]